MKVATKQDKVRWIVTGVMLLALLACVVSLFVMLDRQTSTTVIGSESYRIGTVDETGKVADGDASIYLKTPVTVDDLKIELAKDAKVTYKLYFYDADGKFVSASTEQTTNWHGTVPATAETMRIVITPTADEDGKVTLLEVFDYADQVTVTVKK